MKFTLKIHKRSKFTKLELSAIICFLGLFVFGTTLRYGIYSVSILQMGSPLFFLGAVLIGIYSKNSRGELSSKKFEKYGASLYAILIISFILIITFTMEWRNHITVFLTIFLPAIVVAYKFKNADDFVAVLEIWMKFMTFCVCLMFITEIIDVLSGYAVTEFISNFSNVASLIRVANNGRCVTYMGHPLYTCEIYLSYYIFKHLIATTFKRKESIIDFIIPLVGIALAQGRAALILLCAAFFIFHFKWTWKNVRYLLLVVLVLIVGYELNLFDAVIQRFADSIASGDFSSGRNSSLLSLINSGSLKFFWFIGQENIYDGSVTELGMALEYPFLGLAYSCGIFLALLLSILSFVYPLVLCIIRKQKEFFVSILFIAIDVNSYAGFGSAGAKPLHYFIICCLLLNLSNYCFKTRRGELL